MLRQEITTILSKAQLGKGLSPEDVRFLAASDHESEWVEIFDSARILTEHFFQKKIHFFVPLYFSNFCINNCSYCGFQANNQRLKRKILTEEELLQEARFLWNAGHRTLLLVAGEHPVYSGVEQIASYVSALRGSGFDFSLKVEIAPLSLPDYAILREIGVNQCLLFQETYNREIYARIHQGKKRDYNWRLTAMDRALEAGVENVGLGILLGVGSWQDDLMDLIAHAGKIRKRFGRFPATFSFPRLRPAVGMTSFHDTLVSDEQFFKILALSRLACPEVGIVLTTRETPDMRRTLLERGLGITHMSGGACTVPGGYTLNRQTGEDGQFDLADHRPLSEVTMEAHSLCYKPCFGSDNS